MAKGKKKPAEPEALREPETQPANRTYQVRIIGLDVRPGYQRAGLTLNRAWQSFVLSPEQLKTLQADKRVRVKESQE
jgi:hypothetical protein